MRRRLSAPASGRAGFARASVGVGDIERANKRSGMKSLEQKVKELVLVKSILWARGTDVSELEREIERLRGLQRRADLPAVA